VCRKKKSKRTNIVCYVVLNISLCAVVTVEKYQDFLTRSTVEMIAISTTICCNQKKRTGFYYLKLTAPPLYSEYIC